MDASRKMQHVFNCRNQFVKHFRRFVIAVARSVVNNDGEKESQLLTHLSGVVQQRPKTLGLHPLFENLPGYLVPPHSGLVFGKAGLISVSLPKDCLA